MASFKMDFLAILSQFPKTEVFILPQFFNISILVAIYLEVIWHSLNSGNTAEVCWMRADR